MRKDIVSLGPTLDPHAAFLIQRGMRTYFLRYERQCANALAVSHFLEEPSAREARVLSGTRNPPAACWPSAR
jgi:cystathionine beta-lyase/cystathionine gamma-synthase